MVECEDGVLAKQCAEEIAETVKRINKVGACPILIHKIYLLLFLGKQRHENFIMRHGEAEVVSSSRRGSAF